MLGDIRYWTLALALMATPIFADAGFELMYREDEWCRMEERCWKHDDVLVLKSGLQLTGYFEKVPPILYPFGSVDFDVCELSGVSIGDYRGSTKMQYVTRNGQNFIGELPKAPFIFHEKETYTIEEESGSWECIEYHRRVITPDRIVYARFKASGRSCDLVGRCYSSLILRSGDRFPVRVLSQAVHVGNAREDWMVEREDVASIKNGPYAQVFTKTEAVDRPLPPVHILDDSIWIGLAKNGQELHIPWAEVEELRADCGLLILDSPYYFTTKDPHDMVRVPAGRLLQGMEEDV
ncbi:MAG: hypothetical protein KDK78_02940, partial [Chlamydiia bacterium]|nr:hypothetical protein [Chlamydiia bacterium]